MNSQNCIIVGFRILSTLSLSFNEFSNGLVVYEEKSTIHYVKIKCLFATVCYDKQFIQIVFLTIDQLMSLLLTQETKQYRRHSSQVTKSMQLSVWIWEICILGALNGISSTNLQGKCQTLGMYLSLFTRWYTLFI